MLYDAELMPLRRTLSNALPNVISFRLGCVYFPYGSRDELIPHARARSKHFPSQYRAAGMNTVTNSHDTHVGKLLGKEDETRATEVRSMADIVESRRREER